MSSVWDSEELAALKGGTDGEYVKFYAPGDAVEGEVMSVGLHRWDDGTVAPQIFLFSADGGDKILTASQVRLKSALAQKRPEQGDHLRVEYTGDVDLGGGKAAKSFSVTVTKAGETAPAPTPEAAPANQALPPEAVAALKAAGINFQG